MQICKSISNLLATCTTLCGWFKGLFHDLSQDITPGGLYFENWDVTTGVSMT
jgi:hypothetical protein